MKMEETNLKRSRLALYAALLFCLLVAPTYSSGAQDKTVQSFGQIAYAPALILHQYTAYASGITAQQYASYTHAFQIHYDANSAIIDSIHAIEASYLGLLYRNIHKVSTASPEWNYIQSQGWVLKDTQGNEVYSSLYGTSSRMVDIGNGNYQEWLASWIYNQTTLHSYSGVFCDDGFGAYPGEIFWDAKTSPINPRTGTTWTSSDIENALIGLYNHVRASLGSKIIVGNGVFDGDRWQSRKSGYEYVLSNTDINGVMGEDWWYHTSGASWLAEGSWKNSLDSLVELENTFIKNNSSKIFVPCGWIDCDGDIPLPSGANYDQVAKYAFASTLLGMQSNQIYLGMSNNETRLMQFYNSLFSISIGSPTNNYSMIINTHIYERNFTKCIVLVNPTNSPYNVTLNGTYTDLEGQIVGSFTMAPHTGDVLISVTT
jgi:hypothetical protein